MTEADIDKVADAWRGYWLAAQGGPAGNEYLGWATEREFDLLYEDNDPESLWQMILAVHHKDQSEQIQQMLSAGPLENLLAQHGDVFIERVEQEAKSDPKFARLMGGVWQNSMSDEVWARVQAVWDRREWDGIRNRA